METYTRLTIGSLTGFAQAPHPDCRMVLGEKDFRLEQAGWLMPQVSEVHPKTAKYRAHMARFEKGGES